MLGGNRGVLPHPLCRLQGLLKKGTEAQKYIPENVTQPLEPKEMFFPKLFCSFIIMSVWAEL